MALPVGLRDASGTVHQTAVLRPARVGDEVRALGDFRVYLRPEALPLVLLSRAILRLGPIERVDVGLLERLDAADIETLEQAYAELNGYALEPPQ